MLNWILGSVAAAVWSTAYGWYFSRDIRHWLWRRRNRKALADVQRAQAYAAWVRRPPTPRARPVPTPPPPQPARAERPAPPSATIIPFPQREERSRRPQA